MRSFLARLNLILMTLATKNLLTKVKSKNTANVKMVSKMVKIVEDGLAVDIEEAVVTKGDHVVGEVVKAIPMDVTQIRTWAEVRIKMEMTVVSLVAEEEIVVVEVRNKILQDRKKIKMIEEIGDQTLQVEVEEEEIKEEATEVVKVVEILMMVIEEAVDVVCAEVKEVVGSYVEPVEVDAETVEEVVEVLTDHRMVDLLETRTIETEKQQFQFE